MARTRKDGTLVVTRREREVDDARERRYGDLPRLISTGTVAELMCTCQATVLRMARAGKFGAVRVGNSWKFNRDAVLAHLGIKEGQ